VTKTLSDRWLWAGLVGGVALVLWGLIQGPSATPTTSDDDVAAVVGDVTITADRYHQALALLVVRTKGPAPDAALRRRVLDDLIAEELLLARALELDLPRVAALSRRRLLTDVIDAMGADVPDPTDDELAAWYAANPQQFGGRHTYRVEAAFFKGPRGRGRATVAAAAMRAGASLQLVAGTADKPVAPVPTGLVQASVLRTYLGPTAARAAMDLEIGDVSEPLKASGGFYVVRLREIAKAERPPLKSVRDGVRALVLQERRRKRVDEAVAQLRSRGGVTINEDLLRSDRPIPKRWLRAARDDSAR